MMHHIVRFFTFALAALTLFGAPVSAHAQTIYEVPNAVPAIVYQSIHFSCDGSGGMTVDEVSGLGSVTAFTYEFPKTASQANVFHWSNVLGSLTDRTFAIGMANPDVTAHLETVAGQPLTDPGSLGKCAAGGGVYNPGDTVSPASSRIRVSVLGCGSAVAFQTMLGGTFPDGIKLVLTMSEGGNETERSITLVGEGEMRWTHGQFVGTGNGNPVTTYNLPNNGPVVTDRCRRIE